MCGIAGLFQPHHDVSSAVLADMAARLAHRGPDGSGTYRHRGVGLVHTRLSIIDLEGGAQPLGSSSDELTLVANGEIYNFIELRRDFAARGRRFSTGSDCETILHAYAEYGIEGLKRLNGMFAFALYDARREQLLLARDRLGIKPLFYARTARGWAFASEVKALLPALEHAPRLRPEALSEYLHGGMVCAQDKLIQGVRAVPPGCAIVLAPGREPRSHRYWDPTGLEPFAGSEAEALEEFTELFARVMNEHVRADVPYGLFLSGGVDSGTLAGLLARAGSDPLATYSVGFDGSGHHDELADAGRVAARFGTRHRPLLVAPEALQRHLVEAVWAADDLIQDPAVLPTLLLARRAAQELKVVFSGEGGDEVFAGYGRYRVQAPGRRLMAALDRRGGGLGRRSRWGGHARHACFGPALEVASAATREAVCRAWNATPRSWTDMRRRQYVDIATSLPDGLLVKLDRTLMAVGLEGRVPFLDHRVVEFGLSLPDGMKIRGVHRKAFLKRWAEQLLPADHLYGKKRGFHVPLSPLVQGPMLDALVDLLPRSEAVKQWFRPDSVRELLQRQAAKGDRGDEAWSLLCFAVWHRLFVEGDGRRPAVDTPLVEFLDSGGGWDNARRPAPAPAREPVAVPA